MYTDQFDISVIVTAHSETVVAGPSLRSAEVAIEAAQEDGWKIERIIGLDCATEKCRDFFDSDTLSNWKKVSLDHGDLGLSRNSLVQVSQGRWIAFLDADDLFSENWIKNSATFLYSSSRKSERSILHPEFNIFFDDSNSIIRNTPDEESTFINSYWYFSNYYDSLAIAPREAFLEVPYLARDRQTGFGYEDWRWNLDTLEAGWSHNVVNDTIIFKRRRDNSLVLELGNNRSLLWETDSLLIDRYVR